MVDSLRLHAICVKTRPLREDPSKKSALTLAKTIPSMCAPTPTFKVHDLSEDVLRCSAFDQDHFRVIRLYEAPRDLNDVDSSAREVDVRVELNV